MLHSHHQELTDVQKGKDRIEITQVIFFFFDSSIDEIYIVRTDGYFGITYIVIYVIIIKKNRNQLYYNLSRYLLNLPVKVVMQFF